MPESETTVITKGSFFQVQGSEGFSNLTNRTNEVRQGKKLKNCHGTKEAYSGGVSSWQPGYCSSPDCNWKVQRTLHCQRKGITRGKLHNQDTSEGLAMR